MNTILNAVSAECLKLKRSKFILVIMFLFILIPFMMSMLFYAAMQPQDPSTLGIASTKAGLAQLGVPNWPNYFKLLLQGFAGIGIVGLGFLASWIFGREFAQNTVKDLLALPVSRSSIVIAKFIIVVVLGLLVSMVFYLAGLCFGKLIGLGSLSFQILAGFSATYFIAAIMMIHLSSVIALIASYSRGYMLPIGFVILMVIVANFTGMLGIAPYFPWAIPGIYAILPDQIVPASYVIVITTGFSGYLFTVIFWKRADHK